MLFENEIDGLSALSKLIDVDPMSGATKHTNRVTLPKIARTMARRFLMFLSSLEESALLKVTI
jgi:hypothetical protein